MEILENYKFVCSKFIPRQAVSESGEGSRKFRTPYPIIVIPNRSEWRHVFGDETFYAERRAKAGGELTLFRRERKRYRTRVTLIRSIGTQLALRSPSVPLFRQKFGRTANALSESRFQLGNRSPLTNASAFQRFAPKRNDESRSFEISEFFRDKLAVHRRRNCFVFTATRGFPFRAASTFAFAKHTDRAKTMVLRGSLCKTFRRRLIIYFSEGRLRRGVMIL